MSEIPSNKFEKEKVVIRMYVEGRTIREIAKEAHLAFRDISKIIKTYDKKVRLEQTRKENSQSTQKKPSISSQAFKLFSEGKKLTDVAIELEIPARKVVKLSAQFLKLERMEDCYEFYQVFRYEIPQLLAISSFIRRNKINISNISNIMKEAQDVNNLQLYRSRIANEIERLKQIIKNRDYEIKPLPNNNWSYPLYHF